MHKLDKYCRRFTNDFIESTRSNYYRMNGHILRVSDHISMTTNALFSIVIRPEGYLIHHPRTGSIEIVSYREALSFVKMFSRFPIYYFDEPNEWKLAKNELLKLPETNSSENFIITTKSGNEYPLTFFSDDQRKTIHKIISLRVAEVGKPTCPK